MECKQEPGELAWLRKHPKGVFFLLFPPLFCQMFPHLLIPVFFYHRAKKTESLLTSKGGEQTKIKDETSGNSLPGKCIPERTIFLYNGTFHFKGPLLNVFSTS